MNYPAQEPEESDKDCVPEGVYRLARDIMRGHPTVPRQVYILYVAACLVVALWLAGDGTNIENILNTLRTIEQVAKHAPKVPKPNFSNS